MVETIEELRNKVATYKEHYDAALDNDTGSRYISSDAYSAFFAYNVAKNQLKIAEDAALAL